MSAGTPVVTVNDYDTFPYAPLSHGKNILIAEPTPGSVANELTSLLTGSDLRRSIGGGGVRYVSEHFAPTSVAAEYEAIYAEVLDHR